MKKLLALGFSAVLILSACSEESDTAETNTEEAEETAEQNTNTKQELMRFYLTIPQTINAVDSDLNAYTDSKTEGLLPEGEDLQAAKDAAKESAEQTAAGVEEIEVPETLAEQQEEIESALASIKESYEMKAEELTKEEVSFEAADEKFQEADETFNALLEEQGLIPSSLYNEVTN